MDRHDEIDQMLGQWSWAPYDLPLQPMGISKRIQRMARHLESLATDSLAPLGLEPGEFDVLATVLRSGPPYELTPTKLSHSLLISGAGLTKRLVRMEGRGLVKRRLDPDDRRSLLVELTEEGRVLAEKAVVVHGSATADLMGVLSPAKREQLADLLRELMLGREDKKKAGHSV
ncbi:MarR family winged helix-turn-helix transcriptional regulator [Streptomyces sp. NBC_00893]|uniref:MarR family winged helix-turn-helix transcriptional regulator n=1 Tax=Streptomyces sp. NBC_00893 TaxID=2975862 RepID=UPI00224D49DB|nr:MarR family transcriptional regulator [Streptomyces sp. NBC_00893]MCX4844619.1 MarR family transcriptional regulator [Streptomyces sp. NBC_00893]